MKSFYRYIIFLFLLFIVQDVLGADGGDVLDRKVDLPKMKGTVYSLLSNISQQTGYLFIYDSKVVQNDLVVKLRKGERTVRQAICEIVGEDEIDLKVIGNHILITSIAVDHKPKGPLLVPPLTITLTGTLLDKETGMPVSSASVSVRGRSLGVITNQEGEFRLTLPDSIQTDSIVFSHIGYVSQSLEASYLSGRHNMISLEPKIISLQEVLIQWMDPSKVLREVERKRDQNYSHSPVYLTTFYREGVLLKDKLQNLSEAVFKVYKSAAHAFIPDQVKLLKKSRISNVEVKDSLLVKVKSGIDACFLLDIMKDMPSFLLPDEVDNGYLYTFQGITFIDDRRVNEIHFEPRKEMGSSSSLYRGELYIDAETSAVLEARFEVDPIRLKRNGDMFVERHSKGIRMIPEKVTYVISYKRWQDTYYIHHIRGDLFFKVRRKHFFSTSSQMNIWFEMITCRVDTEQVVPFPRSERLQTRSIFSDMNFKYDEDFWKDLNVIPLEEGLSKLIEKISLKIEQIGS